MPEVLQSSEGGGFEEEEEDEALMARLGDEQSEDGGLNGGFNLGD